MNNLKETTGVCEICHDKLDPEPLNPVWYRGKMMEACEICREGIKEEQLGKIKLEKDEANKSR